MKNNILFAAILAVFGAISVPVEAGSGIDNVVIQVDERGRAVTVIENIGTDTLGYVLTSYAWSLEDGEDVYSETAEFIAVPPTFQLAPGEKRTVRVGFRNPAPSRTERTFRLSVREIPTVTQGEGLAFVFNHMLPVYVAPRGGAEPLDVSWNLVRVGNDWAIRGTNASNRRAVISALIVGGQEIDTKATSTILAGAWRQYILPAGVVQSGSANFEVSYLEGATTRATASQQ